MKRGSRKVTGRNLAGTSPCLFVMVITFMIRQLGTLMRVSQRTMMEDDISIHIVKVNINETFHDEDLELKEYSHNQLHDNKDLAGEFDGGDSCLLDERILTEECMQFHARSIARAFPYKPKDSWCIPTNARGTNSQIGREWQGLLYVKVPKVSSSTLAGVALRINNHTGCEAQWEHKYAIKYKNHSNQTFLLGSTRKPASREVSHIQFFNFAGDEFQKEFSKRTPTTEDFLNHGIYYNGHHTMDLLNGQGGYQYKWLSLKSIPNNMTWSMENKEKVKDPKNVHERLQQLLNAYDSFIVTERIDESLVALALLMDIDISTVLATSAKVSGSYQLQRRGPKSKRGKCVFRRKVPVPQGVYDFLKTPPYLAMTYADQILYRASNISLDLTIKETIGADLFYKSLKEYQRLADQAQDYCGIRLGSGCYENGTKTVPIEPCYVADFLCGYKCLDEVVEQSGSYVKLINE
mmetsp:Transcript_16508/g.20178  ORF Transcript_16508/g.20178 Transcript_16508/m.20178 type:complete len:464 (-) Transcript_16508:156-1547(-)